MCKSTGSRKNGTGIIIRISKGDIRHARAYPLQHDFIAAVVQSILLIAIHKKSLDIRVNKLDANTDEEHQQGQYQYTVHAGLVLFSAADDTGKADNDRYDERYGINTVQTLPVIDVLFIDSEDKL